jgi:hypothetical protein
MRHLRRVHEFWWVPAEHVIAVVTVLHAYDVAYGQYWYANGMKDVAVAVDQEDASGCIEIISHDQWDMFPETSGLDIGSVMTHTSRLWATRLLIRGEMQLALSEASAFTSTVVVALHSDQWIMLGQYLRGRKTYQNDRFRNNIAFFPHRGVFGIYERDPQTRSTITLSLEDSRSLDSLDAFAGRISTKDN